MYKIMYVGLFGFFIYFVGKNSLFMHLPDSINATTKLLKFRKLRQHNYVGF